MVCNFWCCHHNKLDLEDMAFKKAKRKTWSANVWNSYESRNLDTLLRKSIFGQQAHFRRCSNKLHCQISSPLKKINAIIKWQIREAKNLICWICFWLKSLCKFNGLLETYGDVKLIRTHVFASLKIIYIRCNLIRINNLNISMFINQQHYKEIAAIKQVKLCYGKTNRTDCNLDQQ